MTSQSFRPMFPHQIDSTMLSAFRSCPQKFFRQYVQHWKGLHQSVHLVAGGAFATGIEAARRAYYEENMLTGDAEAAGMRALLNHYGDFDCPAESAKSPDRMMGALEFYFSRYPLGCRDKPLETESGLAIEHTFSEPLGVLHPITGKPILYTGRSDMLGEYMGGKYAFDEKTTSSLGQSWGKQWEHRSQFTGYLWCAARQGIKLDGAITRGVSILKTKYDTMEIVSYRSKHEVIRWYEQVLRDLRRMIHCWESGMWDYSLDAACNEYGGCQLTGVCKSARPDAVLENEFEQRVWNPLERRDLTIAEHEAAFGHIRQVGEPPAPTTFKTSNGMEAVATNGELAAMLRK